MDGYGNDPRRVFLPSFIAQAEEEIEHSRQSGEYAAEVPLLEHTLAAVKTQDRKELERTVSEIRSHITPPCRSILNVLLDTIDTELLGKPSKRMIRCPSCGGAIRLVMDHIFLARRTCPSCNAEIMYSDDDRQP